MLDTGLSDNIIIGRYLELTRSLKHLLIYIFINLNIHSRIIFNQTTRRNTNGYSEN